MLWRVIKKLNQASEKPINFKQLEEIMCNKENTLN